MDDLECTVRGMVATDFAARAEQAYAQHPEIIPKLYRKVKHVLDEDSFPYHPRKLKQVLTFALQPGVLPSAIYYFWVAPQKEYGPIEDLLPQLPSSSRKTVQEAYDMLISCIGQKEKVITRLLEAAAAEKGDPSLVPFQIPSAVMHVFKTPDDYFDFSKRNRPPPITDGWDARFARGGSFGVPEFSPEPVSVRSCTPPVKDRVENSLHFKRSHESSTILYVEGSDFVFGKRANQVLTESVCKTFLEIVAPADIQAIYHLSN